MTAKTARTFTLAPIGLASALLMAAPGCGPAEKPPVIDTSSPIKEPAKPSTSTLPVAPKDVK